MKFIHISDIHLGDTVDSGFCWEEERDSEKEGNLLSILREAAMDGVDLVMIAGGLFARTPVESELKKAADIFGRFNEIEIVIIAGGRDALSLSSPARSFIWPQNVHYILGKDVSSIALSRISTEVYAASVVDGAGAFPEDFLKKSSESPSSQEIKLAMIRTDEKGSGPSLSSVSDGFVGSEFAYIAVGGPLKYSEIVPGIMYASGCLEPQGVLDPGEHGYIEGEILAETGTIESISFKKSSSLSYVTLNIRISSKASAKDIDSSIRSELDKRGKKNIYSLNISGMRDPDESLDFSKLKEDYRILKITDTTEPDYDYTRLFYEHPQDLIGYFIRHVSSARDQMSAVDKRAMFYGIDALISTMEKGE